MHFECRGEGRVAAESHGFRNQRAVGLGLRRHVCLLVVQVLQAVLEVAQKLVRCRKLAYRRPGQKVALREQRQRGKRGLLSQFGVAPAADQLEYLRNEFDFADAAGPELDVVGDVAALHLLSDLPVEIAQRRNRVVIEVSAVDERAHQLHEFRFVVPGDRARLDPGVAFPFPSLGDEVVFQRVEADGERSAVPVRPQAHVNAEHVPVGGHFRERRNQLSAEPGEVLVIANRARPLRVSFFRISEDEVDVGGDVQLGAAKLAHAQHVQLLRVPARGAPGPAVLGGEPLVEPPECVAHCDLGESGGGRQHLGERGEPSQIARDQPQHDPFAQCAQGAGEACLVVARRAGERGAHFIGTERTLASGIQLQPGLGIDEPARVVTQPGRTHQQRVG